MRHGFLFIHHLFLLLRLLPWRLIHLALSLGALVIWAVALGLLVWGRKFYRQLSSIFFTKEEMEHLPTLSILVPACNEEATIERAMRSLLALDYPCFEIVAVNDRSTDATGFILEQLAKEDPRLRVFHVDRLPMGWLGKNHALHVASAQAKGEWLLFTDADVVYAPQTLRKAVAYARRRQIDHLVLAPRCETHDFWERLFVSYFSLMFSFRTRPWALADARSSAYVGLGAFNLVRAEAYRRFGGHKALAMEVIDDVKLGKMIRAYGFRSALMQGSDLISVRWVVGLRGIVDGLTKNAFAGFDFNLPLTFGSSLLLIYIALYPLLALLLPGHLTHLLGLGSLIAMMLGARTTSAVSGAGPEYGLGYPLAALLLVYVILRSTWWTYRQNGVVWRGTLYPLDELRRGVV
jgi:glycosyltransferase involved in cell wall biosynthesis